MERFIEQKENFPLTQKSVEELALEMNKALEDVIEMTEEELIEDDAEADILTIWSIMRKIIKSGEQLWK